MANNESKHKYVAAPEIPSLNYDVIKDGYWHECPVCGEAEFGDKRDNNIHDDCKEANKQFREFCEEAGWSPTYKNYQKYLTKSDEYLGGEILDWDLQKRLQREDDEYEYQKHLTQDGYRKVTLTFCDKAPMEKWILRTTQPLKDNCVVFKCEGEEEIFGLIEDEDVPTMDFYDFANDEEVAYTSEELNRILKEKKDPNFLWNLHTFRKHCRKTGMDDSQRYYWKWIEIKEGS